MGCLFDYYRVCPGDIPASGIAANGFKPDGAPGVGNSLAELRSDICHGGIGWTGAICKGGTAVSRKQCRAAGSDSYGSHRYENKKLARNGSCGDGFDHGFTLLLVEAWK